MGKLVKCNKCKTKYDLDAENKCPNCGSDEFSRDSIENSYKNKSDDD